MKHEDQIDISGAQANWRIEASTQKLVAALRKGRWIAARSRVVVSISFVGAAEMSRLNAHFRGKARPTDVLSFEQSQGQKAGAPRNVIFLGDLVLCSPVVRAQAKRHGHGVRLESVVLLAHGFLHLLGYDHERSAREDRRMAEAEAKLLNLAGFRNAGLIRRAQVKE